VGEGEVVGVTVAVVDELAPEATGTVEDGGSEPAPEHPDATRSTNIATTALGIRPC